MYKKAMKVSLSILYWIDIEIAATVGSSWVSTVYLPHQLSVGHRRREEDVHDDSLD